MEELIYKVYALLDANKCITSIEGSAFHDEKELLAKGYIKIDEGQDGSIYGHCQPNYLQMKYGKPLYDEEFKPNFKYVNKKVVELTKEEKEKLFPPIQPQPTEQEKINAQLMLEIAKLKVGAARGL